MKDGAPLPRDGGQLRDRLNRPDFVVGVHDRDEGGIIRQGVPQRVGRHDTACIHRQERRPPTPSAQSLHRVQNRLVLDGARDDVPASGRLESLSKPPDGDVVAFGPAARKYNLGWIRTKQVGNLGSSFVEERLGSLPKMVNARRVAEFLAQYGRHPVDNRR